MQDVYCSHGSEEACSGVASKCQLLQLKLAEVDVIMDLSTWNLKCYFLEKPSKRKFSTSTPSDAVQASYASINSFLHDIFWRYTMCKPLGRVKSITLHPSQSVSYSRTDYLK
jgi:hypothetical protein